jgi:hypothetical protein
MNLDHLVLGESYEEEINLCLHPRMTTGAIRREIYNKGLYRAATGRMLVQLELHRRRVCAFSWNPFGASQYAFLYETIRERHQL